jgi:hypothetical protein
MTGKSLLSKDLIRVAGTALALALPLAQAGAAEVAGHKISDAVDVSGSHLTLNGAGIRYKGPFKVYIAAMYFEQKASTPEQVYATPGARRIELTMLRDIDSSELGRLFMRSMQDNTQPADMLKIMTALPKMGQIFAEQKGLATGESVTLDWIPGTGTVISTRKGVIGTPSTDPEFYRALLSIWLGHAPADWMLKDALLGVPKSR